MAGQRQSNSYCNRRHAVKTEGMSTQMKTPKEKCSIFFLFVPLGCYFGRVKFYQLSCHEKKDYQPSVSLIKLIQICMPSNFSFEYPILYPTDSIGGENRQIISQKMLY